MKEPFGGLILNVAFRMLVPFTITYGIYVLCLGEFSPGGGFQAGALLSVGFYRLADLVRRCRLFPELQLYADSYGAAA